VQAHTTYCTYNNAVWEVETGLQDAGGGSSGVAALGNQRLRCGKMKILISKNDFLRSTDFKLLRQMIGNSIHNLKL